jgi:aryl-alcohol dehydrogenase-like predicted oxidoreductase
MKTKQLEDSDLFITPGGFGAWAAGGAGWQFGWGKQNDNDSVAAIHRALQLDVNREVEPEILPFPEDKGLGVMVYSPMASALLTGAMTRERISRLPNEDWRNHEVAWTLRHSAVTAAIVDACKPEQVDDVVAVAAVHLTQSELTEIEFVVELGGRGQ